MKKHSLALFVVLMVSMLLAASVSAAETAKIRVWIRGVNDVATRMFEEEVIPGFEKLHPGVEVEFRPLTFANNYIEIDTAIAAGNPPDIMTLGRPSALKYADKGVLLDLTEFVKSWDRYDDFYEFTWTDSTDMNGRIVSLPVWLDENAFIYNKRLFEEAGLDPNAPPETWEDLASYAQKMTKYDAQKRVTQAGFKLNWGDWMGLLQSVAPFVWQNGGTFLDEKTWKTATVDQPEFVEGVQFAVDLLNKYKVDNYKPWGEANATQSWIKGQFAMQVNNTGVLRDIYGFAPDRIHEVGVALPPGRKTRATFVGGTDLGVAKASKHPELALEFIKYLYTTDSYLVRLDQEIGWQLSPLKSHKEASVKALPVTEVLYDTLEYGKSFEPIPENMDVRKRTAEAIEETIYGLSTPEQALKQAAKDINKMLQKTDWTKKF